MAKPRRAYFIDGRRFTPSQFRRLSAERKVEAMVQWFGDNFENPAERTSYVSAEGGYLWNHGGPFDAAEELHSEFGDMGSEEAVADAVRFIEEDGTTEWASANDDFDDDYEDDDFDEDGNRSVDRPFPDLTFDLPSYDAGVDAGEVADGDGDWPPLIGVPAEERDLRSAVIAALDRFEAVSDLVMADRARRGHNHPPEMIDDGEELPWAELEAARDAASELRDETGREEPDTGRIISAIQRVKTFTAKFGSWLAVLVGGGVVQGAAWDGVKGAYQNSGALYEAGISLATTASEWVQHLGTFW